MIRPGNPRAPVVICLGHGRDDPERVAIAHLLGIAALRTGRQVVMWLTADAVELGLEGVAASIRLRGGPSIDELHDEYTGRGGQFHLCATSVHVRGLTAATWIRHAELKDTSAFVAVVVDGAVVLHA